MLLNLVLFLNCLWFGAGFWLFSLNPSKTALMVSSRKIRKNPLYDLVKQIAPFVGGFNLAFLFLCLVMLTLGDVFTSAENLIVLFSVIAVAHATQFYGNVPNALKDWRNEKPGWRVLKGPMLFIFIGDFVLMVLNAIAAGYMLYV